MGKTHWKQLKDPNFIGTWALPEGNDLIVKIEKVVREIITVQGGKKEPVTLCYLKGQKPLILNSTNQRTITNIYNSPYVEDWIGKDIKLFASTTRLKGENVECLRIRQEVPAIELPELTEKHNSFEKCAKALSSGNYTTDDLRKKYLITDEVEKQLIAFATDLKQAEENEQK